MVCCRPPRAHALVVQVIHAERTKQQRDTVVKQFRSGKVWVLIATDLMARGLDFKGVKGVGFDRQKPTNLGLLCSVS